jgi:hypothetical protein
MPHYIDNRLIDGRGVVTLTHRPQIAPEKHFSVSGIHFCSRLSKPQGLIGSRICGKNGKSIPVICRVVL